MASLISKKKGHPLYYYIVQSARVDGQPRIVQQTYLGTAERLAALVKERTAPLPLSANGPRLRSARSSVAGRSGFRRLEGAEALWPPPRSGPSTAHYLLLAAMHRICQPGPKTEVADGYRSTILQPLWTFSPEHCRSQDFWDALDRIRVEADPGGGPDELEEAQL